MSSFVAKLGNGIMRMDSYAAGVERRYGHARQRDYAHAMQRTLDLYISTTAEQDALDQTLRFQRYHSTGFQRLRPGFLSISEANREILKYSAHDHAVAKLRHAARRLSHQYRHNEQRLVAALLRLVMATNAASPWWVAMRRGHKVLLGEIVADGGGVCRHRAMLFKILADAASCPCKMVRGQYVKLDGDRSAHSWCEIALGGRSYIVETMANHLNRALIPADHKASEAYVRRPPLE